jgi:hypothetical protein
LQKFVSTLSNLSETQLGDRFAFYAKRVQSINLGEYSIKGDDENGIYRAIDIQVLSAWFRGNIIFSRLRRLRFGGSFLRSLPTPSITALIKNIFRAANLTVLMITTHIGSVALFEDGMEELLRNCSSLEELALTVHSDHSWTNLLSIMLSRTTRLCSLTTMPPISYTDLLLLADYPYLRSLRVEKIVGAPEGSCNLPHDSFRQLRRLGLQDSTPFATLTRAVLSVIASGCLTECSFRLGMNTNLSSQDIQDILQTMVKHASLTRVYISISAGVDLADVKSPEVSATFFRSFHSLPKLKHLKFGCNNSWGEFPIDDVMVADLTQACPKLRRWNAQRPAACAIMSFCGFLDLLHQHPHLEKIPISVDASVLPSAEIQAEFGHHKYGPVLTVEDIEVTAVLQEVISRLFPRVKRLWVQKRQRWPPVRVIPIASSTAANDVVDSDSDA